MTIVLSDFQVVRDVRLFDDCTGTLSKTDAYSWKEANGCFSKQDGSIVCYFRHNGRLHLYFDGVKTTIDPELTTTLDTVDQENHFQAFRGDELIFEKKYPRKPDTDGNPFWPSDPEDQDIFLFVHNIVGSPERQQQILELPDRR